MILLFILVFVAGALKAAMDTLQFHYDKSVFKNINERFWNPLLSHTNKYKNGNKKYGDKFFGSSTAFVFLTDAWHLLQSVFLISMFSTIVLYKPVFNYHDFDVIRILVDFIILRLIFGLAFVLFYNKILIK